MIAKKIGTDSQIRKIRWFLKNRRSNHRGLIVFVKCIIRPFRMHCIKYFTISFLDYHKGSKSLIVLQYIIISSVNKNQYIGLDADHKVVSRSVI